MPTSVLDYFPDAKGDGLRVTWARGINNKARLANAIRSPAHLVEGEVTMSCNSRYPVPVLSQGVGGSDLTLEEWLGEVLRYNSKGVQLNFQSTEVVEPACRVLARVADHLRGPIILNADIQLGPHSSSAVPVDAWTFLTLCRTRFPRSIISIGWTTDILPATYLKIGYTRDYVDRMVALVKEYTLMQPVMFPVHASLLKYSIPEMQRLLFQVPNSSLCVWSTKANPIESIDELLAIRKSFNIGQVFYKLPDEQLECFFSNT
ncbi:protein FAM151B-like [Uloborus diversus]|uniref:protein FAM151B-like n=1 Tax=Uloborus diversus TaxID=327109 RepID=UPI0024099579|nr:protein FAM151B-like [Uloborus diversus]